MLDHRQAFLVSLALLQARKGNFINTIYDYNIVWLKIPGRNKYLLIKTQKISGQFQENNKH